MQPSNEHPKLGPLRPRDEVLPAVVRRGSQLRRRRRVLLATPIAIVIAVASVLVVAQGSSPLSQRVHTNPATHPPADGEQVAGSGPAVGRDNGSPSAKGRAGASGPASGPAASRIPGSAAVPDATTSTLYPHPANCGKWDDNPHPGWPDCSPTYDGSTGNYAQQPLAQPGGRGCVVHNAGATSPLIQHPASAFFCSYDAIAPGGYTTNAPFVILRIVRGGRTIDYDGHTAPRCEPTGFIQPGDHVYVDGRNGPQYGYTTLSAGDVFHC